MPRVFLCDPSLLGYSGHCFEYLVSLVEPCRRAGYEAVVVGHQSADARLVNENGVVPLFTQWCDARYETPDRTRDVHEDALRRELRELASRYPMTADDVVLLNTLRHWPLRAVAYWLEELPPAARPTVALVLHFTAFPNPERWDGTVYFYREAFERLAGSPARDRLLLLADAEELVSEYSAVTADLGFRVAPIPHVRPPLAARAPGPLRLGYVGEARQNKGFDLLPRVVRRLAEDGLADAVRVHVHTFVGNPAAEFYRKAMAGLRHPCVVCHPHQMDGHEYERFLASLDVLLLPYQVDNYHVQTSGVFAEGMADGKLMVVSKGTWMARQAARYGGGVAFNPGDAEDFARATAELVRDFDRHAAGAAARAARWRAFHNPDRLVGMMTAFADGGERKLAAA